MEASSWDALRKQARKLEAQLDELMNSYRRLVSTKPDGSESDLESGIERFLKQLQQVNSQMQTWVSSGGSEILSHTLTRHREILQDLTQEFYRLRSSLRAKQEHASLLLDFRDFERARLDMEDGAGSVDQALLKEQAALSRSSGQVLFARVDSDGWCNIPSPSYFGSTCSSTLNIWWHQQQDKQCRQPTSHGKSYPFSN
ncbi:Golgi SNAP receptor complex member 1-1-like isoform X4 [Phoenix dactylifera]|uniref:Golgi SNAP receptor complex member 1-1-like isoform X4 n=1 Tax=Phoenix dactylifera TaxID=42345 RepID=A0A8B8J6F7_PHODC|nr:Golgi SNAP receptor complex member 1-1-like isoform X4 [Phoenix dactylifera]